MISYDKLCRALDRYNNRQPAEGYLGEPAPEAAPEQLAAVDLAAAEQDVDVTDADSLEVVDTDVTTDVEVTAEDLAVAEATADEVQPVELDAMDQTPELLENQDLGYVEAPVDAPPAEEPALDAQAEAVADLPAEEPVPAAVEPFEQVAVEPGEPAAPVAPEQSMAAEEPVAAVEPVEQVAAVDITEEFDIDQAEEISGEDSPKEGA